jgi:hypothetical protein
MTAGETRPPGARIAAIGVERACRGALVLRWALRVAVAVVAGCGVVIMIRAGAW